jgi:GT2 family glycosyltransferase
MDLSIVIVTWNSEEWLKRCLTSIFAHTSDIDFEVIVVDNKSKDQTIRLAMNSFSGVNVIENQMNKGWATAVNQGVEASTGRYICVLNPDTELVDQTMVQLVEFMDQYPNVGVAGPHLINEDQSTQRSVRRRPRLRDQLMIILKLHIFFPDSKSLKHYLWRDFNYQANQEVEQIMGACMMIRREVFEEVGIFDETFFLWFDEVDFCRRVYDRSKYKIFYNAHIHLLHAGGDSFDKVRQGQKQKWYLKSLRYYFRKHRHWWSWFVVSFFSPLSSFLGVLSGTFKKSEAGKQLAEKNKDTFKKA